jgi:hypothetical protein
MHSAAEEQFIPLRSALTHISKLAMQLAGYKMLLCYLDTAQVGGFLGHMYANHIDFSLWYIESFWVAFGFATNILQPFVPMTQNSEHVVDSTPMETKRQVELTG